MDSLLQSTQRVPLGRRHMAVLRADLCGLDGLVDSVGPERVVEAVAPLMTTLVRLVRDHNGDVQQILADGLMSVFGLRTQEDNEAALAVRAGAALVTAAADHRAGLPVHVGIECGEVLVSQSWEPAGYAVWGRAVTAARRLCDTGRPGTTSVGRRAAAHAADTIASAQPFVVHAGEVDHDATRTQLAALTRAESAVARLVARGLSNPQIASELHISKHTAETHMKHIFAKLSISSRAELAAMVARSLVALT